MQEVKQLMSGWLVTEVEARQESCILAKKVVEQVLLESGRVNEKFVAAARTALNRTTAAVDEARIGANQEAELLSLEMTALRGRVSTTLQGRLDAAADDVRGMRGGAAPQEDTRDACSGSSDKELDVLPEA